ncbi:hypothetical protein ABK040_009972 [Willaertia magna]
MPLLELSSQNPTNLISSIESNHVITHFKNSDSHIIIVTEDNSLFVHGKNHNGQLGTGDFNNRNEFVKVNFNENIKQVEVSPVFTIIVTEENNIYFTGEFKYLFNGEKINTFTKIETDSFENEIIKLISCNLELEMEKINLLVVTENYNIYTIGYNGNKFGLQKEEHFIFTKINKLTNDGNKLFIKSLQRTFYFDIILDFDGNLYRNGIFINNNLKYFTKFDLPFKVKSFTVNVRPDVYFYVLNYSNEIYKINDHGEVVKVEYTDDKINVKYLQFFNDNLFIINKDTNIYTIYKNNTDIICSDHYYKYHKMVMVAWIKNHLFSSNYKFNFEYIKLKYSKLNYLNYNLDNIYTLLNKKYLNSPCDLTVLIKNKVKTKTLEQFKNKEYNYELSFIISLKLCLLNLLNNYKIDNRINLSYENLFSEKNKEQFNLILKVLTFNIKQFVKSENEKYKINEIVNYTKSICNNLNNLLTKLNVNQELLFQLDNLIIRNISLNSINTLLNDSNTVQLKQELKTVKIDDLVIKDKYLLISKLGKGAFGVVFKVFDIINFKYLALKVLTEGNDYNNLKHEFILLAKLEHENVIKYLDFDKIKKIKKPFLVMELCDYSLDDKLYNNSESFLLIDKLKLFLQICKGVEYLHLNNIIHRDLKLLNILIENKNNNETIKIVDFGTARQIDISKTRTINIGTEPYMAPEMRYSEKLIGDEIKKEEQIINIDKPLDIYALGYIIEMLINNFNDNDISLTKEQSDTLLTLFDFQKELLSEKDKQLIEKDKIIEELKIIISNKDILLQEKDNEIKRLQLLLTQLQN